VHRHLPLFKKAWSMGHGAWSVGTDEPCGRTCRRDQIESLMVNSLGVKRQVRDGDVRQEADPRWLKAESQFQRAKGAKLTNWLNSRQSYFTLCPVLHAPCSVLLATGFLAHWALPTTLRMYWRSFSEMSTKRMPIPGSPSATSGL